MRTDYKKTIKNCASQESVNNSEWTPLQNYSGAIAVIVIAISITVVNIF